MSFQASLEKGSKKYPCPSCGQKTFTKYVDNSSGAYLDDTIGRCDRETKCGYHKPPGKTRRTSSQITHSKAQSTSETKPPTYIPYDMFNATLASYQKNHFTMGLSKLFGPDKASTLIKRYHIGTIGSKVVFWQIDQNMRIRTGKIMDYDPHSLKRQGKYFLGSFIL